MFYEIINESNTTQYLRGICCLLSKCRRDTDKKPGFCPDAQDFSKKGDYAGVICTRLLEGGGCGDGENAQILQMVNVTLRVVS